MTKTMMRMTTMMVVRLLFLCTVVLVVTSMQGRDSDSCFRLTLRPGLSGATVATCSTSPSRGAPVCRELGVACA